MGKISSDLVSSEFVTTDNKDAVKLDEVGEPTDNTDLNVDAARHGLCPKLSGNADDALKGDGTWGEVSGGSGGSGLDNVSENKWKYLGEDSEIGLNALACYQFDGSGEELNDRSGNGYTLTVTVGTRYYTSLAGLKALQFNDLQLAGPDTEDLRLIGDITIEFVFFGGTPTESQYMVSCTPDTDSNSLRHNTLYSLGRSNEGKTRCYHEYGASSTDYVAAGQAEVQFEPIYYVVTRNAINGTKFYINGVLSETLAISNMPEKDVSGNLQILRIGGRLGSNNSAFQGSLSSVRISNTEFSANQIANVYSQISKTDYINISSVEARWNYLGEDSEIGLNALACYQFDGSGNELNDRSGNGYTLTVENGTRYYNTIGGVKALEFNNALSLLGPDTDDLRITGAISVEFIGLIREKSSVRGHIVYIGGDSESVESLTTNVLTDIRITTSNLFEYAGEYDAAGTDVVCSAFSQKFQNEVHYFVMTRSSDGLTINLYIDGVLVQTRTADHITEKDASGNLQRLDIGNWYTTGSDEFLDGALTSVRITDSELSANQIANIYKQIAFKGSPLTTKGDIYIHDGSTINRLPVGTDDQIIVADSTEATGLKWGTLPLEQQGYTVEDDFSDSSIHERWTVSTPGSTTVVEGSDGIVLTNPSGSDDDPVISMNTPENMHERNWILHVHATIAFTSSPGNGVLASIEIKGQGGGAEHNMVIRIQGVSGPTYNLGVNDDAGSIYTEKSAAMWLRMRRFGDEIRTDYYEGAATVDVDAEGRWVEYDSTKTWYVVPKSATYNYPIYYEYIRLLAHQAGTNPGFTATFRNFKLRIF